MYVNYIHPNKISIIDRLSSVCIPLTSQNVIKSSTSELHTKIKVLKVKDIQKTNILCFVNSCLLNRLPDMFQNYYIEQPHVYALRHRGLYVKRARTSLGAMQTCIIGAKLWNELPPNIKKKRYQVNFRHHVVNNFLRNYAEH